MELGLKSLTLNWEIMNCYKTVFVPFLVASTTNSAIDITSETTSSNIDTTNSTDLTSSIKTETFPKQLATTVHNFSSTTNKEITTSVETSYTSFIAAVTDHISTDTITEQSANSVQSVNNIRDDQNMTAAVEMRTVIETYSETYHRTDAESEESTISNTVTVSLPFTGLLLNITTTLENITGELNPSTSMPSLLNESTEANTAGITLASVGTSSFQIPISLSGQESTDGSKGEEDYQQPEAGTPKGNGERPILINA